MRFMPTVFIENEGALFRGHSRSWPDEVWSPSKGGFVPYEGSVPKPIGWGEVISAEEAEGLMRSERARRD